MKSLEDVTRTALRHGNFVGRTKAEEDAYYATFEEPLITMPEGWRYLRRVAALAMTRRLRPSFRT